MDLKSQIINFPEQLKIGAEAAKSLSLAKPTSPIVIAGMGGSALPGKILQMIMPDVRLHEDYDLPPNLPRTALAVCVSWSGDTEETVSAYNKAIEQKLETVVITSGGPEKDEGSSTTSHGVNRLAELAKKNGTPLVLLPNDGLQPRMAVGYMTGALLEILGLSQRLNDMAVEPLELEAQGQEIAKQIGNPEKLRLGASKTPLIYTTAKYQHLAYFWKILFNENCKIHAFSNYFPRMQHNELAGFNQRDKDKFFYITFRDETENPRQNRNLDAALAIMNQIGYNGINVNLSVSPAEASAKEGSNLLAKVFNNYLLGLWTSYYLAQELGVDPSDIKVIEDFKSLKRV